MPKIRNNTNNAITVLRTQHIFGRHPVSSNTLLDNPEASRLHAMIQWDGQAWSIQDTSHNGTFINSEKIPKGLKTELNLNDQIQFGALNCDRWQLLSINEPKSLLVPTKTDLTTIELDGIVVLPNENHPEITLYQNEKQQWLCESQTGISELQEGEIITIDDMNWYFLSSRTLESTSYMDQDFQVSSLDIEAHFKVSQNEEHVSLNLMWKSGLIQLGERVHHYLLLILARKNLSDKQSGVDEDEQGWLDKDIICHETGLEETHVNIQIYRFRKQLMQSEPQAKELLQIIQRRRREIRLTIPVININ